MHCHADADLYSYYDCTLQVTLICQNVVFHQRKYRNVKKNTPKEKLSVIYIPRVQTNSWSLAISYQFVKMASQTHFGLVIRSEQTMKLSIAVYVQPIRPTKFDFGCHGGQSIFCLILFSVYPRTLCATSTNIHSLHSRLIVSFVMWPPSWTMTMKH